MSHEEGFYVAKELRCRTCIAEMMNEQRIITWDEAERIMQVRVIPT